MLRPIITINQSVMFYTQVTRLVFYYEQNNEKIVSPYGVIIAYKHFC